MSRSGNADRQPAQRSAVSNGSQMLPGVKGTSAKARRYRDLVETLTDDLGGDLSEAERLVVRNAATLQLHAEELTAAMVRGETVDPEAITRAANGATRALTTLRKSRAQKTSSPRSVASYLRQKQGGDA